MSLKLGFKHNKNGFSVMPVHYTMDPDKSGPEWAKKEKKGMPDWMWRKEYEMDPYAASGKPAFPDLSDWQKYIYQPLAQAIPDGTIPPWWKKFAGFDWGFSNPTAVEFCTVRPDGVIVFYWEYYKKLATVDETDRTVKSHPHFNKLEKFVHDPSMSFMTNRGGGIAASQKNAEEKALADEFSQKGWVMVPGMRGNDVTFIQWLYDAWQDLEHPKVIICQGCYNLWWELLRLRHEELSTSQYHKRSDPEKIVDKDNHAFDAMKYVCMSGLYQHSEVDQWQYMDKEERMRKVKPPELESDEVDDPYLGALV